MIEETPHRLKEFDALNLVGVGGVSVVFSAVHLAAFNSLNNDRPVALKFVWDVATAQQEVRRLILLDSNRGVNKLYGYFEAPLAEVRVLLTPLLSEHQALRSAQPADDPSAMVGILVMQLSKGCHLMKTRALEGTSYSLGRDEWVIDHEGRPYLQSLAIPLSTAVRIAIIRSLIKIIIEAHDQDPPQVHGDLHPGNVHFNPTTEEVVVLDWSGLDVYGAAGWITPWHDHLVLGEIQTLPKQTDVYLIALWVDRLLGNTHHTFRRLANSVLASTGACDIRDFSKSFEHIVSKLPSSRRGRWKVLLVAVGLMAVVLWQRNQIERYRYYDHRGEIKALLSQGLASEEECLRVLPQIEALASDSDYRQLWWELESIKRTLELKYKSKHDMHVVEYDLSHPQAVFVSRTERFVVYDSFPFVEGDLINNEYVIQAIGLNALQLRSPSVEKVKSVVFVAHPLLESEPQPLGCLLLYGGQFRQIAHAVSRYCKNDFVLLSTNEPRALGLVYEEDPCRLMDRMFGARPTVAPGRARTARHLIYDDSQYIRYWDLAPGMVVEGKLAVLVEQYLHQRMGFELGKIPNTWSDQVLRREVTAPTSCLKLFGELVASQGYEMLVDQTGASLAFRKQNGMRNAQNQP